MKKEPTIPPRPVSMTQVNRILIILVIALAFLAGYFHAKAGTIEKKYQLLEGQTVAE